MDIRAYFVYTIVISALIYPVVCHWAWNADGWATKMEIGDHTVGVIDFAGSGVVHMTGGMAGLVGAIVVGPRKYRFDAETVDEGTGNRVNWGVGWSERSLPEPRHSNPLGGLVRLQLRFYWCHH
jgi:ammonia channel protein AmtB